MAYTQGLGPCARKSVEVQVLFPAPVVIYYINSMRKFLSIFLLSAACCLLPAPVYADYQSAYNDYSYNYTVYRNTYNDYQVSKSTFLTYHTLTSQNDAIDKMRAVLKARDQVMLVYYNLLQEKLNATPGVEESVKITFGKIKESEKNWLTDHQKKIEAANSLEDLNSASAEFENRYPQMDTETKQAVGEILLAKENNLGGQVDQFINNLNTKLTKIRQAGEATTFADRGIINTKNKLELFRTKLTQSREVFYSKNSGKIELFTGQQKLLEANQYLREAVNFLSEIIKSYTG